MILVARVQGLAHATWPDDPAGRSRAHAVTWKSGASELALSLSKGPRQRLL